MPLKNSNAVAVERRVDLASLFCMIGRHGPAVALAVIAMVSVLAGFIIYRTVRGKRRKATAGAADGEGRSPGAERDAPEPSPEDPSPEEPSPEDPSPEEPRSSGESTDVSDDAEDVKEDADLIPSDLKIRHRRAAADKTPPPHCPPTSDSVPGSNTWAAQACYRVAETYAEEAGQSLQSDTRTVAAMAVEDDPGCHQGSTDDPVEEAEEDHDNDSCLKTELIHDESHGEEEKVLQAEYQEVKTETTDVEEASQEEENLQRPVCFDDNPHLSDNGDNKLQLDDTTPESNLEEPVVHIDALPVSSSCSSEGAGFEDVNHHPESIDSSNSYSSNQETKNEGDEAEEERVDGQLIAQQAETVYSAFEQETDLPSSQQDQCDEVTEEAMPSNQSSDMDDGRGPAGEVIEGETDKDHLNSLADVEIDSHPQQFDKQQLQTEHKDEDGLTCNQEGGVGKERVLTSDDIDSSGEEHDGSCVVLGPALTCVNPPVEPEETDNGDEGVRGPTTDAPLSDIVDSPDSSSDNQQPQSEAIEDKDADLNVLGFDLPSVQEEIQSAMNESGTDVAEESVDHLVSSCYEDQPSDCIENTKTLDETRVDPAVCDEASFASSEISHPDALSSFQDEQSGCMEDNEACNGTTVNPAPDADVCVAASFAAPVMSAEISHLDTSPTFQDQSDQMLNNADFPEVTTGAAPHMTETINPPMYQIYLPSFGQSEQTSSSSGLGGESGISSMTVSPDSQDAADGFVMVPENVVLPVMDCDLQFEEQAEAQNSLFADDAALSVMNEDAAGTVFESCPSHLFQQPHNEHADGASDTSFASNEDVFGNEVEASYYREMDQLMTQIAADATSLTDEPKKPTVVVEVGEIKEEKKEGAEKEEEEDYERTEISIMEATMDHNEWITEGNYQVLPWMNLSVPSFAQDHTKVDPLPTEERHHSPTLPEVTCTDTDIPSSTEVIQTNSLSLVDENAENHKKVVAVQPMPQNVNVTFRIHYLTDSPYQKVAITGNQQELGSWKGFIPLERAKDGLWTTVVSLPAESLLEWKFVVVDKGEVCRWEECGNRLLDTGCGDDLVVHKSWGFL